MLTVPAPAHMISRGSALSPGYGGGYHHFLLLSEGVAELPHGEWCGAALPGGLRANLPDVALLCAVYPVQLLLRLGPSHKSVIDYDWRLNACLL